MQGIDIFGVCRNAFGKFISHLILFNLECIGSILQMIGPIEYNMILYIHIKETSSI